MGLRVEDFALDKEKQVRGVWVDVAEGSRLLIARKGNSAYRTTLQRLMKPFGRQAELGMMSNDKARKIIAEAMAETVLLGWEGITENGADLAYSTENAKRLMQEHESFFDLIEKLAEDQAIFRKEEIAADAAALGEESRGKPSGDHISES